MYLPNRIFFFVSLFIHALVSLNLSSLLVIHNSFKLVRMIHTFLLELEVLQIDFYNYEWPATLLQRMSRQMTQYLGRSSLLSGKAPDQINTGIILLICYLSVCSSEVILSINEVSKQAMLIYTEDVFVNYHSTLLYSAILVK